MATSTSKKSNSNSISCMERVVVGTVARTKSTRNISIVSEDSITVAEDENDSCDENLNTNSQLSHQVSSISAEVPLSTESSRRSRVSATTNRTMQTRRPNKNKNNDSSGEQQQPPKKFEQSSSGDDTSGYQTALETEEENRGNLTRKNRNENQNNENANDGGTATDTFKSALPKLELKSKTGNGKNGDNDNHNNGKVKRKHAFDTSSSPSSVVTPVKRARSSRASSRNTHSLRPHPSSGLNCPICNMNFPAFRYADVESLERAVLIHVTRCSAASADVDSQSPAGGRSGNKHIVTTTAATTSTRNKIHATKKTKVLQKPNKSPQSPQLGLTKNEQDSSSIKRKSPQAATSPELSKWSQGNSCIDSRKETKKNSIPLSEFVVGARFDVLRWTKNRGVGDRVYPASVAVDVDLISPKKRVKIHFNRLEARFDEWIDIDSSRIMPNSLSHLNGVPIRIRKLKSSPQKKEQTEKTNTVNKTDTNTSPTALDSFTQSSSVTSSMQAGPKCNAHIIIPDSVGSAVMQQHAHVIKGNEGIKVADSGHLLNQTWWRKEKKKKLTGGKKRQRAAPLVPQFDLKSCLVGGGGSGETAIASNFTNTRDVYADTSKKGNSSSANTCKVTNVDGAGVSNTTETGTVTEIARENQNGYSSRTRGSKRLQSQAKFKSEDELTLRCPECQRIFSATWMVS
mmetsp:Transcript_23943/g.33613  ORF Transcript_23943/g.33613 Transcript_23943/m.33613 type:complete len:684 (+) Transcript_23943:56-2107(+)